MLTIDLPHATARKINELSRPWRSAYTRSAVILSLALAAAAAMGGGPIMGGALPFVAVWAWLARHPHAAYIRAIRARKFDDAKRETGLIGRADYMPPTLAAVVFGGVFLFAGYSTLSGCLAGPDPTVCPTATGAGYASAVMIWLIVAIVSLLISPTVWPFGGGEEKGNESTHRGAHIQSHDASDADASLDAPADADAPPPITLGGLPIPRKAETLGLFAAGAAGSGKTQAILRVMLAVRQRGERALVFDPSFEFVEKFYRPGIDHILNPMDARDCRWDPVPDLEGDRARIAGFLGDLFPDVPGDKNAFFTKAARAVMSAGIEHTAENGDNSMAEAMDYVMSAPEDELYQIVAEAGLAGQAGSADTFSNVRASAVADAEGMSYLWPSETPFSIREWVQSEGDSWLFLPSDEETIDALRPIFSTAIGSFSRAVMSLRPDIDRRVWMFLDELSTLNKIPSLEATLTKGRKYGLCTMLCMQSAAQGHEKYGEKIFDAIVGQLASRLILRVGDKRSAQWASEDVGDRHVRRVTTSTSESQGTSTSPGGGHMMSSGRSTSNNKSTSTQEQFSIEPAVLYSQIKFLPNMEGYVRIADDGDVIHRRKMVYLPLPDVAEPLIRVRPRPRKKTTHVRPETAS